MKRAVVFAGGTIADYSTLPLTVTEEDYIICADCGALHCANMGLKANLWVGDFDSCDFSALKSMPCVSDAEIEKLNPQKDDTDTEHAVFCAIEKGFCHILLIGGTGSRFDHSLSNVYLMEKCHELGASLVVINENNIIRFLEGESITLEKRTMKYVSILPMDREIRVSCDGLKYPLVDEKLYRASSRGISNEIVSKSASITIHEGKALVIESRD